MNEFSWRIDGPRDRGLYDIYHDGDNKRISGDGGLMGLDNVKAIADGLAARHRTDYRVTIHDSSETVHEAKAPERPREE